MTKAFLKRLVGYDRRLYFNDFARIKSNKRKAKTKILQIYSSFHNIGNYIPVIGIQQMLGYNVDKWDIHDPRIDFDFINRNYKGVIIGGAGLLHKTFTSFYKRYLQNSKLPFIFWGVGGCYPHKDDECGVAKDLITKLKSYCTLTNFRDDFTANFYDYSDTIISACPSIVFLENLKYKHKATNKSLLYSSHEELANKELKSNIVRSILAAFPNHVYDYTDNVQTRKKGLYDIIKMYYNREFIITTRLHGAIIAYGLGIPHIIISYDQKLESFNHHYGNGIVVKDLKMLNSVYQNLMNLEMKPIQVNEIREFGRMASCWISSL